MPRFDTVIMTARFPGTATDGTTVRKGDTIAFNTRTRKVVTSDPTAIDAIQRQQNADAHDMRIEDDMARACGF